MATKFGTHYVLGIENPALSLSHQRFEHFPATADYTPLTNVLNRGCKG